MTGDKFQLLASRTISPKQSYADKLANFALGLAGEAGEVIEPIKKHLFHGKLLNKEDVKKELGDVCWYVSAIASTCGLSLSDIMESNIKKLEERYPDGFPSTNNTPNRDGKEL